jgi:signal transduction histidine kinase/CheY-like chemotaxis protein
MKVWWGPRLVMFYNDAYLPTLGKAKHPAALGHPAWEAWPEIWDVLGPVAERAMTQGEASWFEDVLLFVDRELPREEVYVTFSISPIPAQVETGGVGGVFCASVETTGKLVGARRLDTLRALGSKAAITQTVAETCRRCAEILGGNPLDVPWAALYAVEEGGSARLAAAAGLGPEGWRPPDTVSVRGDEPAAWPPLQAVLKERRAVVVDNLGVQETDLPRGPWSDPVRRALLLPIQSGEAAPLAGILVAGMSPRRPLDPAYGAFLERAADLIGNAMTDSRALFQNQKLESLGILAGGIAHDFNNLLGAMQGNVELAMTEASLERVRPHLDILDGLMAKGAGLLRQILAYAGQGQPRARPLDLNQVVREMIHLLGTAISKKVRISLDLAPGLPALNADPAQLQQVIMNLVINASEAMGERTGVITVATRAEQLDPSAIAHSYPGQPMGPGLHVGLEVSDNGSGIAPEVLGKIFAPFFTTKLTGRGLGLAALHGIVREHRGIVQVASELGRGSTFKVLFPAVQGEAVLPVAPAPPLPFPVRGSDGGTVLVVDDEEEMRSVMVKAMGRAGLRTLQARDGIEALNLFQEHRDLIRLILMDLTMPNMDGVEACRELRRKDAGVPVVLCSGFSETEALHRFDGLGLAGFLQKPFALGTLVELARKLAAQGAR